jgi:hypothetical protein
MNSTVIGFAISMAFLFLMLSAACSAIQEIVSNIFRWRAQTLEKGLAGLLMSEQVKDALYELPIIKGLHSPNVRGQLKHKPSYIPSSTLALAILDLAVSKKMNLTDAPAEPVVASASDRSAANPPTVSIPGKDKVFADVEILLRSVLRGSKDVDEQKERLENWYNDSMTRISGWYKRKSHAYLWIFGILLCLALNADSISLSKSFWNDQTLRDAMVAAATEYVKNPPKDGTTPPETDIKGALARVDEVRQRLPNIPLGWCHVKDAAATTGTCWPDLAHPTGLSQEVPISVNDPRRVVGDLSGWWFWKAIGVVLTALAISQGAPFWFDLLQKAVNLRLAGEPPPVKTDNNAT